MAIDTRMLVARARDGDGEAFGELTDPFRHELLLHCYRMLGSLQDAEDVIQESLLAAWLGIAGFELTSALKRGRANLDRGRAASRDGTAGPPAPGSGAQTALVERFVRAYEASDVDGVIEPLTDDAFMSMPPRPLEYQGIPAVAEFLSRIPRRDRRFALVPTRANGQPAFGTYLHGPDGSRHGTGLLVLDLAGDRVGALTRFESTVLPWFGLPRSLPCA